MSWSYSENGYFRRQRDEQGEFVEGEVLSVDVPEENLEEMERWNPGCSTQVKECWNSVREIIFSGGFGDPITSSFKVSMSGHYQGDTQSVKDYVSIRIERE